MQGCKTSNVTSPYTGTVMCYYVAKMSEKHKNKQTKVNNSEALSQLCASCHKAESTFWDS